MKGSRRGSGVGILSSAGSINKGVGEERHGMLGETADSCATSVISPEMGGDEAGQVGKARWGTTRPGGEGQGRSAVLCGGLLTWYRSPPGVSQERRC